MKVSPIGFRFGAVACLSVSLLATDATAQREITRSIDEIRVTAQKREESAQDIPVAVTALDAAAIEKTFARDLLDVTGMAPNLIIDPILGNGTAAISIRGMQLNDVEKSFDPAVAVYLDGIYLATTTGALLQIWDSEAVEVLRGPQGTLFGRNTIGGLVHVRRKRPSGEFGGRVTATAGSFDRLDLNATVNSSSLANDTLSFKGTVMFQDGGGYFDNPVRGQDEGDTDFLGLTGMVLWEPTENFSAWLTYDYFDDKTPTRPVTSLTQAGETFDGFCGTLGLCGGVPSDEDYHRSPTTTQDQQAFVETNAVTLNAEWDWTDNHTFALVAGWRDTDENALQEFDGIGGATPGFPFNGDFFRTERPQTLEQTSVEFRLQSEWGDGRAQTVFGLYAMDTEYTLDQITTSLLFFGDPADPAFPPGGVLNTAPQFVQETSAWAAFGQLDLNLNDYWSVSLGGRFTDEEKEACGNQRLNLSGVGLVTTVSYGSTGLGLCNAADPFYSPLATNPVSGAQTPQDGKESWDAFTPRVNLTYQGEFGIAFVTYSEGFRSGGFNGRSTEAFSLGPYEPEEVKAWEIGAKT
ncbi:MAG: TonB-dependent receptor, partial [Pseudomonadota bacterium]